MPSTMHSDTRDLQHDESKAKPMSEVSEVTIGYAIDKLETRGKPWMATDSLHKSGPIQHVQ